MTVFRYKREVWGSGQQFIMRPVADVYLETAADSWLEFHPYIDSGADVTMIPLSLGKLIGLNLDKKKVEKIGGIRGSVPVVYAQRKMKIGSKVLPVKLAWALIEEVPPLLGRTDVFDQFEVVFKQKQGVVEFV